MTCLRQSAVLVACVVLTAACGRTSEPEGAVASDRVLRAPVERTLTAAAGVQPAAATTIEHSPAVIPPTIANASLDARVLVITADGTDPALGAITGTLARLGTPFDVLNATTALPLTADQLANGAHGRYYAVVLDRGALLVDGPTGPTSAFSNDEWTVLTNYEAAFGVRRAVLYGVPDAEYGFGVPTGIDTATTPLPVHCTPAGAALFATVNCDNAVSISRAFAYVADPIDADTVPLLIDDAGHALAATRHYPNGREALVLTFAQNDHLDHTLQLVYGVVHWVTKGIFLGERHAYFGSQIDDLFLTSALFTGGTYRITDADLQTFFDSQQQRRARPNTAALRFDFALNTQGTTTEPNALRDKAKQIADGFKWISHTYDHADLTAISYADAYDEFNRNNLLVAGLGLKPYSIVNLVTPNVSGLNNPEAMRAAFDLGVRFLVTDTSVAGYDNVPFNQGQWNPSQPQILMIPRHATNLFYNVSTPTEWVAEYNSIYFSYWNRNLTYDEILDFEGDLIVGYMLDWQNDLLMFHQANSRSYDGAHSLLNDLMDRVLTRYEALVKLPVVSPTMDELGLRVANRMRYDAASATATIGPGSIITVRVTAAATVPLTGVCTTGAEIYGGDPISHVDLDSGAEIQLSLNGCAQGGVGGTTGAGGAAGVGGATGDGGMTGDGGAVGTDGMTGGGGAMGTGGMTGTGGETGTGGATGLAGIASAGGATGTGGTTGVGSDTGGGGTTEVGGATGIAGIMGSDGATDVGGITGDGGSAGVGTAIGTGGTTGTGGAIGAGGTRGATGGIDPGGTTGAGGVTGTGGGEADGGLRTAPPTPDAMNVLSRPDTQPDTSGCACSAAGGGLTTPLALSMVMAMLLASRRRSRSGVVREASKRAKSLG